MTAIDGGAAAGNHESINHRGPIMTAIESFADLVGCPVDAVTHCVPIGTRGERDVYAVGYWNRWGYTSGTAECCGDKWGPMRLGHDMDIERCSASVRR